MIFPRQKHVVDSCMRMHFLFMTCIHLFFWKRKRFLMNFMEYKTPRYINFEVYLKYDNLFCCSILNKMVDLKTFFICKKITITLHQCEVLTYGICYGDNTNIIALSIKRIKTMHVNNQMRILSLPFKAFANTKISPTDQQKTQVILMTEKH